MAVDAEAVLMCPFASRGPFHVQIVPRTPAARFEDDGPLGAALLHEALGRLAAELGGLPPLNMWVRTAPRGAETSAGGSRCSPGWHTPPGWSWGPGCS